VEPRTPDEVAYILSEASRARLAVIPLGGGQHQRAANAPDAYDVALCTRHLDRIVAHEPADLTVTVEAGLRLTALQERLARSGQHLPLDPPCGEEATIGGVLAANAYGPLRHAYGTARDWLLGARVVHADGTLTKCGGRVVKNVAGYDIGKLYIGSQGTLGLIAEMTFKVAPLPKSQATVTATLGSAHAGSTLAFAAHDAALALHALELMSPPAARAVIGESRWTLMARAAGGPAAVDRTLRELRRMALGVGGALDLREGDDAWAAWSRGFRPASLSLRASVQPSDVGETMDALDRRVPGAMLSATVSSGLIRVRVQPQDDEDASATIAAVRETLASRGGLLFVDAAPAMAKRGIDVFGTTRGDFAIMQRLKEQFDPARTLSPGRFAGGL